MTLSLDDALPRLAEWGLIEATELVEGGVRLSSVPGRNLNLRIEREDRPTLLIKQPDPAVPNTQRTLEAEARFYEFCRDQPAAARVLRWMPSLHSARGTDGLVVVEWLDGTSSLWQAVLAHPVEDFPGQLFRQLGQALGDLHSAFRVSGLGSDPGLAALPEAPPTFLTPHRPRPRALRYASPANLELCRILQTEAGLAQALDRVAEMWLTETVIHGDLRSSNVLVGERSLDCGSRISLVDWELVQRGDPAWDVADVLKEIGRFWMDGMSSSPLLSPEDRLKTAAYPLPILQEALRLFWREYGRASGTGRSELEKVAQRAVSFTGVRLVQALWESTSGRERLSPRAVAGLQLAVNVLLDPSAAARDLFAFPDDVLS